MAKDKELRDSVKALILEVIELNSIVKDFGKSCEALEKQAELHLTVSNDVIHGLRARLTALEAKNGSLTPQAARSRRFDPVTHEEIKDGD